jgi:dephospho-CoA kinase
VKKNIILVSGKKFTGKDTVANYLCNKYGYVKMSFADDLKQKAVEVARLFGASVELEDFYNQDKKNDLVDFPFNDGTCTIRKYLQNFGTEFVRNTISADYWVLKVADSIANSEHAKFVIPDIRFPNEIETLKEIFKDETVNIIRVERVTGFNDTHASETSLDIYKFENTIFNDRTLNDLYETVDDYIKLFNLFED